ncbi:hypothetical protein NDU88_006941 [Pleurodeles waltl]|uniref:LysR substrate-binding domain-containing protein n=1 Tax=Pleurodeles waltl TaxID=8319 RepID=A0AAV7SRD1_PLEWA|nr:hypothetical protein NDU88_006941 [Pleurodeles waltl]
MKWRLAWRPPPHQRYIRRPFLQGEPCLVPALPKTFEGLRWARSTTPGWVLAFRDAIDEGGVAAAPIYLHDASSISGRVAFDVGLAIQDPFILFPAGLIGSAAPIITAALAS